MVEKSIMNEFLKELLTNDDQQERIGFYLSKLDNYMRLNTNDNHQMTASSVCLLNSTERVKFLEATLYFVQNFSNDNQQPGYSYTADDLILIQVLIQRITDSMRGHLDLSTYIYLF
jgi:hypothetical protein